MTKNASWKAFSFWLPGMMFMVAFVLLGYAIYDWQTSPSEKVLSKIAFEPFPEFVEGAKETITIRFENTTIKRLRVVGMETCWGSNCSVRSDTSNQIPFEVAPNGTAEMLFEVAVGKPGPIGQAVHLFLDEEGVLKKIDLEFESVAIPKIAGSE